MAFNYALAKQDGLSDQQIAQHLSEEQGFNLALAVEDGLSYSQLAEHLVSKSDTEESSFLREAADVPLLFGQGAVQMTRMGTQVFGANNPVAQTLMGVEDYLGSLISAGSRDQQEEIAKIFEDAEGKGVKDQVVAGLKALTVAPVDTIAQFGGSAVPFVAAGVLSAAAGPIAAATVPAALGVTTGVGLIKGTIFDVVQDEYIQQGVDPETAKQIAEEAQGYLGENIDQIALGGVLGGVAARFGIEKGITQLITKKVSQNAVLPVGMRAIVGGMVAESVPEAVQAGQQQFASNLAKQRKGFEVDLMEGVIGQSVFEGGAGLILGGGTGALRGRQNRRINDDAQALIAKREQEKIDQENQKIQDQIERNNSLFADSDIEIATQSALGDALDPDIDMSGLEDYAGPADLSADLPPPPAPPRDLDVTEIEAEARSIVKAIDPIKEVSFVSEAIPNGIGYQVIGSDGESYGAPVTEAEPSRQLALRLNQTKLDQQAVNSANDSINNSNLGDKDTSTIRNYLAIGNRALNPRYNEVTSVEIDAAADATTDESIVNDRRRQGIKNLSLKSAEYYLTKGSLANRAKSNAEMMRLFTPSQRVNYKRREKGLPPKGLFSMAEARVILGKNFGNLADTQVITPEIELQASMSSRTIPISQREKGNPKKMKTLLNRGVYRAAEGAPKEVSLDGLNELLKEKNITSAMNSKEMKPLLKAFTGISDYKRMKAGDRRVFYKNINRFSDFAQPTKLPVFSLKGSPESSSGTQDAALEEALLLPAPGVSGESENAANESPTTEISEQAIATDKSKIRPVTGITQQQAQQEIQDSINAAMTLLKDTDLGDSVQEVVATQGGGAAGSNAVNGITNPVNAGSWNPIKGRFDKFIFNIQDKFIGLKRIEEGLAKGAGIDGINTLDSAYDGIESITGIVGNEFNNIEVNEIVPLLDKLSGMNISRDEFNNFLILRHAIERNAKVREINQSLKGTKDYSPELDIFGSGQLDGNNLTDDYVRQRMAADYGMTWNARTKSWEGGNSLAGNMSSVAADFDMFTRKTLKFGLDSELLSQEEYDNLISKFKYYVPLKGRVEDSTVPLTEDEEALIEQNARAGVPSAVNNYSVKGAEGKRISGRTSQAFDPLANAYAARMSTVARGVKNKQLGQRLYDLIKANPNDDVWMIKQDEDTSSKQFYGQTLPTSIGFKKEGKQVEFIIKNKRLREALLGMDTNEANIIVHTLRGLNRFLSAVNTSYNPEFIFSNFSRDVQTALANLVGEQNMKGGKAKDVNSWFKLNVIKDVLPSVGQVYKGFRRGNLNAETQKLWDAYLESGAKTDFFYARSPEETSQQIDVLDEMARGTFKGNSRKAWRATTGFVSDINGAVENGVRFATFKASRKQFLKNGDSVELANAKAATLAKNLTVNFNRKGNMSETANALYLFFNASVQGSANFVRGLSSGRKQSMLVAMASLSYLLTQLNEDSSDEDPATGRSYYDGIPDYEKERNMIIMKNVFNPDASPEEAWKIPLPYGYNVLHVLGLNIFEVQAGQKSIEDAGVDLLSATIGSFAPIGVSQSEDLLTVATKAITPQFGKPFLEMAVNENHFGSPIYRDGFPTATPLPDSAKGMRLTPQWMKNSAQFLNEMTLGPSDSLQGGNPRESGPVDISPDTINHLINSFTGGAGMFGVRGSEYIRKLRDGEELEDREIPFKRRIMTEANNREGQSDFYRRKDVIGQKADRMEDIRGSERVQYRTKNLPYLRMGGMLSSTEKRIRGINKRLNIVRERMLETTDVAVRLKLLDQEESLQELKDNVYGRFNKRYDETIGREK